MARPCEDLGAWMPRAPFRVSRPKGIHQTHRWWLPGSGGNDADRLHDGVGEFVESAMNCRLNLNIRERRMAYHIEASHVIYKILGFSTSLWHGCPFPRVGGASGEEGNSRLRNHASKAIARCQVTVVGQMVLSKPRASLLGGLTKAFLCTTGSRRPSRSKAVEALSASDLMDVNQWLGEAVGERSRSGLSQSSRTCQSLCLASMSFLWTHFQGNRGPNALVLVDQSCMASSLSAPNAMSARMSWPWFFSQLTALGSPSARHRPSPWDAPRQSTTCELVQTQGMDKQAQLR